ncbi:MAG: TfoX/Sxy family protein [Bryobacteraceae bacterium]
MPYDERLAERVRSALSGRKEDITERRVFGGVAFLVGGNMCCGVTKDLLVLRLGSQGAELALGRAHIREMDFTGKPTKGMVYVEPQGVRSDAQLQAWLEEAMKFARTLPKNQQRRGERMQPRGDIPDRSSRLSDTSRRGVLRRSLARIVTAAVPKHAKPQAAPGGRIPRILVFDVNETLLDVKTLEPHFARLFGDKTMFREWFHQVIQYAEAHARR